MTTLTDVRWKRVAVGGIAPHAISIGLLVAAIVAYTFLLALGTGGEPDQGSLEQFNVVVGTQLFPIATILLTVLTAAWVVGADDRATATTHGLAVGLLVALIGLAFGAPDVVMLLRFVSTVAAGVLGARLGPAIFGE
ncbi:hypothetical protein ACNS7O_12955 [Haloferacaceae archaeon DSL9]